MVGSRCHPTHLSQQTRQGYKDALEQGSALLKLCQTIREHNCANLQPFQKPKELSGFEVCNSPCITKGHPKNTDDFFSTKGE